MKKHDYLPIGSAVIIVFVVVLLLVQSFQGVKELIQERRAICLSHFKVIEYTTFEGKVYCLVDGKYITPPLNQDSIKN